VWESRSPPGINKKAPLDLIRWSFYVGGIGASLQINLGNGDPPIPSEHLI
jgi:hypothetical protein